jgi:hypothetical protein
MEVKQVATCNGIPYVELKAGCGFASNIFNGFGIAGFISEPNARLMTAAPKLLACLIHLVDRDWFRDGSSGQVVCCLDADQVRAALTNALSLSAPEVTTPVETQSELLTVKNETRVGFLPCYQVGETIKGQFGFKTPTGRCDGFFSKEAAQRAAAHNEKQDRAEAITGTGPIAAVLRKYFAEADGKEVA